MGRKPGRDEWEKRKSLQIETKKKINKKQQNGKGV